MWTVKQAKVRRMAQYGGEPVAEVEVVVAERPHPLKVYMRPTEEGYEVTRVLSNDADYELDWYDNDLHQAFEDLSASVLQTGGRDGSAAFAGQIVSSGGVKKQLDEMFHRF
jgi:hypothetical protein